MLNIANMIWTEVCDLDFYDFATQSFMGSANELQDMNISNSQDEVYALGKNEAKLSAFSKNKGMTLSGTSGQFEQFLIGLQTGSGVVNGEALYEKAEVLTVGDDKTAKATFSTKALKSVSVVTANGVVVKNLELAESVTDGKYTFAPLTGVITFGDDVAIGDRVRVSYDTVAKDTAKITNDAKTFSKIVAIVGNTIVTDGCSNTEYLAQLRIPKAKVSGTFDINLNGEPAVQSFEITALTGCGQTNLWDLLISEGDVALTKYV